jgi:hypothetical protein
MKPSSTFQNSSSDNQNFSSDVHFYGKRRESRSRTTKITINSMPITETVSSVQENSNTPAEPLTPYGPQPDISSIMYNQLSAIFAELQKEPMSADERHESLRMLKNEAHEELIRSWDENPSNTVRFANLETKAFLLMEKIEQEAQCLALQEHCLAAQPDLDKLD